MRAPFQILAIPYRTKPDLQFAVLHRADHDQWQFIAGGGKDEEIPREAAVREISEEAGITAGNLIELVSMIYIPASIIA